jgi:hypothetical protein
MVMMKNPLPNGIRGWVAALVFNVLIGSHGLRGGDQHQTRSCLQEGPE